METKRSTVTPIRKKVPTPCTGLESVVEQLNDSIDALSSGSIAAAMRSLTEAFVQLALVTDKDPLHASLFAMASKQEDRIDAAILVLQTKGAEVTQ